MGTELVDGRGNVNRRDGCDTKTAFPVRHGHRWKCQKDLEEFVSLFNVNAIRLLSQCSARA